MVRGVVIRQTIRKARHRLRVLGGARRLAFASCVALTAWTWWAAQASEYAGLPVNVLGQIAGDLVLMGLLAPLARRVRPNCTDDTAGTSTADQALAIAKDRIQLLNPEILGGECASLVQDIRAALKNHARIEVLLPDPRSLADDITAGPGSEPGAHDRRLEHLLEQFGAEYAQVQSRGLDLRLYSDQAGFRFIRCDERMWVSMRPSGQAPAYVALNRGCGTAAMFRDYFDRLHYTARTPSHGPVPPPRQSTRDCGTYLDDRAEERRR